MSKRVAIVVLGVVVVVAAAAVSAQVAAVVVVVGLLTIALGLLQTVYVLARFSDRRRLPEQVRTSHTASGNRCPSS